MDKGTIREIFLRNGFTIKDGQTDLKPYVYAAAHELIALASAAPSGKDAAGDPVARVDRIISASGLAEVSVFLESALKVGTVFCAALAKQSAAPSAPHAQAEPVAWGRMDTVGDMVCNLLTLDQAAPIFAAFHVDIEGQRRCRTKPVTISRERVIDGKWVDSSRKDVPYAHVVWAKPDERSAPVPQEAEQADRKQN